MRFFAIAGDPGQGVINRVAERPKFRGMESAPAPDFTHTVCPLAELTTTSNY